MWTSSSARRRGALHVKACTSSANARQLGASARRVVALFASAHARRSLCRRRQKENQEDLLDRVNKATLAMLSKSGGGAAGGAGPGRKITDIQAYKAVNDMQHNNTLTVQVDHKSECVLVPIYGILVPFHILTIKNASNNQARCPWPGCVRAG